MTCKIGSAQNIWCIVEYLKEIIFSFINTCDHGKAPEASLNVVLTFSQIVVRLFAIGTLLCHAAIREIS